MAVFRCKLVPDGPVRTSEGVVEFVGGTATVDDPAAAAALCNVPDVFGVSWDAAEVGDLTGKANALPVPEDAEPDEITVARPSTADPKARWSYYVQAEHGVDPDDAEAMTKAELMAYGQ